MVCINQLKPIWRTMCHQSLVQPSNIFSCLPRPHLEEITDQLLTVFISEDVKCKIKWEEYLMTLMTKKQWRKPNHSKGRHTINTHTSKDRHTINTHTSKGRHTINTHTPKGRHTINTHTSKHFFIVLQWTLSVFISFLKFSTTGFLNWKHYC